MVNAWLNSDGLYIKYGTSAGHSDHRAGEFKTFGPSRMIEIEFDLADLTATETILNDTVVVPNGAMIECVELVTEVAAATGTAIDVGVIKLDRTTEGDYNGFLAAHPTAEMGAVGTNSKFYETATVPASLTGTGALVGQVMTYSGYISASRTDTTAFSAGRVKLRLHIVPNATSLN